MNPALPPAIRRARPINGHENVRHRRDLERLALESDPSIRRAQFPGLDVELEGAEAGATHRLHVPRQTSRRRGVTLPNPRYT